MNKSHSLQNLSFVGDAVRDTAERQARRAAQAAASLLNPTRLTLPNPTKLPKILPHFPTFESFSSSAVPSAVGVLTQSVSRIPISKPSSSLPPRPPPPRSAVN